MGAVSVEHGSGVASYLAKVVKQAGSAALSYEERALVRQHMLDAVAAAFVGCRSTAFDDLIKLCPKTSSGCVWPGGGLERLHPLDGAMIWAFAINASVFEDGSREGACHPAAAVISTIIALSEGRDWELIDRAAVAGYEVMVRLARGGNPGFTKRGFHPTAIAAPFGAAATASLLLKHDLPAIRHSLCLAGLGSAGLMSSFRSGQTQPLQVAWAVRSGIAAAMLAGAGHSGYPRIIEDGFYPAYLGTEPIPIDKPLEHRSAIKGSYLKPYPGCRHLHPSIDAFAQVMRENKINPPKIETIRVRTYKIAVDTGIHDLNSRGDAYFNIPYALAARMVLGRNDWDSFGERHFINQQLIEVMKKVNVEVDSEIEGRYPNRRGAIVEVRTPDGHTFSGRVSYALGEPENPLPDSGTKEKFRESGGPFLAKKSMGRIESMLDVSGPIDPAQRLFEILSENIQTL